MRLFLLLLVLVLTAVVAGLAVRLNRLLAEHAELRLKVLDDRHAYTADREANRARVAGLESRLGAMLTWARHYRTRYIETGGQPTTGEPVELRQT